MFGILAGLAILIALFAMCAFLIRPDETTPVRPSPDRNHGVRP